MTCWSKSIPPSSIIFLSALAGLQSPSSLRKGEGGAYERICLLACFMQLTHSFWSCIVSWRRVQLIICFCTTLLRFAVPVGGKQRLNGLAFMRSQSVFLHKTTERAGERQVGRQCDVTLSPRRRNSPFFLLLFEIKQDSWISWQKN